MSFIEVLILAFFVALTGAMSPGPLLTYSIYKAIQAKSKAFLVGIFVCIGHAILEFVLILILLMGMGPFISNKNIVILIGIGGGTLLLYFGISLLRDINKVKVDIEEISQLEKNVSLTNHPIIGGVLISMSNPYWWLWWAVIGLNFMTQFAVSLSNLPEFWGFFIGHELGDFAWYGSVTLGIGITQKFITDTIYKIIIVCCSIFMMIFGTYLAISPFFL